VKIANFREVVCIDFEYTALPGELPVPTCCVAHELHSGRRYRIWQNEFRSEPPFAAGTDVLVVAFYASAEMGCYRVLGWPMPHRLLDLFAEFRCLTNGLPKPAGSGLLGALAWYGIDGGGVSEKQDMQQALGSDTWRVRYSKDEVLDYCERDVFALDRLLSIMLRQIDLPRALLRGRYMVAVSTMEHYGVPIDTPMLALLRENWSGMQDALIREVDRDFHVFDGRTFKYDQFEALLSRKGAAWPRLESGRLDLSDDVFRQQAKANLWISPLRELRSSLADLRLESLTVGKDGRNRVLLSPFRARTSRNQPSNAKFVFGPSVWIRALIKPPAGYGLAYVDWRSQEIGIAAKLSGDLALQYAYCDGDPYLAFGKQSGLLPSDATKNTHAAERELFKQCFLATGYGQGEAGLAQRIGQPLIVARDLLRAHRRTFRDFWAWSDAAVDCAVLTGKIQTVFGWTLHLGENPNPRALRNFPVQGNAAEMMRLAACLACERGLEVCAPVHDAFLLCAPLSKLDVDIASLQACMAEASRVVLDGFELDTDVSVTRWPNRYMDRRGAEMWDKTTKLLQQNSGQLCA
jgi:hypothetical protein